MNMSSSSLFNKTEEVEETPVVEEQEEVQETTEEKPKEEEETPTETPVVEEEPEEDNSIYGSLLDELVEEELIYFNEEEEYDVNDPNTVKSLIQQTRDKAKENGVSEYKSQLPENAQALLDVLEKGGSFEDYESMNAQIDFSQVPIENDEGEDIIQNQINLVEDKLTQEGWTKDEISAKINRYRS